MGAVKRGVLLFCAALLLPAPPCLGADPGPPAGSGPQPPTPRYQLNYRNAIRGLPCPDLARLQVKMKKRYQDSGTPGERNYYRVFLQETENMMNIMLCPPTGR